MQFLRRGDGRRGLTGHLWLAVSILVSGLCPCPGVSRDEPHRGEGRHLGGRVRGRYRREGRLPLALVPRWPYPSKKFFFQIPISRVGTCCPDTRQVFPGHFEVSGRNFFSRGYDTPWRAALVRPRVRPFLWGRSRAGPKVAVIPLENFFSQISISRVGTCCPDTREVFSGVPGMIGYDSQIDATW